jgi:hypothetical protein
MCLQTFNLEKDTRHVASQAYWHLLLAASILSVAKPAGQLCHTQQRLFVAIDSAVAALRPAPSEKAPGIRRTLLPSVSPLE